MARAPGKYGLLRVLAIMGGALLLILASISLTESLSRAGPYGADENLKLYIPDQNDIIPPDAQPVRPVYEPEPAYIFHDATNSPSGYFEISFEWHRGDPPPALLLGFYRRIDMATLNGNPIATGDLNTEPESLFAGIVPRAIHLDVPLLKEGANIIRLRDVGRASKILAAYKIVPAKDARSAQFWGEFFEVHMVIAATAVMLFVMAFCLFMRWPREDRFAVHMLALLLLTWSVRNVMAFGIFDGMSDLPRLYSAYWIGYLLVSAFAAYAMAWAGWSRKSVAAPWAIACALMAATLVPIPQGPPAVWEWLFLAENIFLPAMGVFGIGVILWSEYASANSRPFQALLLIAAVLAVIIDALDEKFQISIGLIDPQPFIYYATPRHGVLVALGMWAAMIFHQVRARRLSDDLNGVLESRLAIRESELEQAYEERADLERRSAAVAERERIMMDVHDGLGARLLVLEQEASSDTPDIAVLRDEIGGTISEVRIIADSLNSPDADFQLLWGSLRHRLSPRLEAAGIQTRWIMADEVKPLVPGAQCAQHIARIVQEAVSNIIRHSGARNAVFRAELDQANPGLMHLCVEDDGQGMPPDKPDTKDPSGGQGGRGLGFMRRRAQLLDGRLDFAALAKGVRLDLIFPLSPGQVAQDQT